MKSLSKLALCLLLAMSLTVSAFAAQVPDSLVAENLNGQQRLVKTYTLSPEITCVGKRGTFFAASHSFAIDGYSAARDVSSGRTFFPAQYGQPLPCTRVFTAER